MLLSQSTPTNLARSYGITGTELDAFEGGLRGVQPHPNHANVYALWKPVQKEHARAFGCAELVLDTWTDPMDPKPFGMALAWGEKTEWIDGADLQSLAERFLAVLDGSDGKLSHLVVWNGMGVVFHTFLRHLARPLTILGCKVQPFVTGVNVKAISVTRAGTSCILCDPGVMAGSAVGDSEGFTEHFGGGLQPTMTRAASLQRAVSAFQNLLLSTVGVAIRPTIAAVSLKAARYYLPEGYKWFRPNLGLESVCRYGGAYRGGYVYSEPYQGKAWRIDVNKMYTTLLRSPLPAGCTLSHAGETGREHSGIFLSRVYGESHFPAYLTAFVPSEGRFHKQSATAVSAWSWLPSAEIAGLRAIGYQVECGLGFKFTDWVSFRGYADHLLSLQTKYARGSPESLVAKALGNALTGKLGQAPDRLDVCYSIGEPRGGWVPFVTAEREVITDLWIKRQLSFSGGQHVDAAAWLTAMGRGKMYAQLARVRALGWKAVHVDTDGVILDSDPRKVLALSPDRAGGWRFDGYDPDCLVAKGKWYSFQGEVHTAGLSGVTREQLEAVHYGRKVVIGRKVLSSPLAGGPLYRQSDYRMGES